MRQTRKKENKVKQKKSKETGRKVNFSQVPMKMVLGVWARTCQKISKMAAFSAGYRFFLLLFILPRCTEVHGWDSIDLELFDIVEEIKDNFYDVLGLKQVRSIYIKFSFRVRKF